MNQFSSFLKKLCFYKDYQFLYYKNSQYINLKFIILKQYILIYIDDHIEVDWSKAQERIIWDIRLSRVLLGAVVGAELAVVGVVIQALVRNSLADPYILGISSGSSVAAMLVILFGALPFFGQYALSLGTFFDAIPPY
jgi:ABC-type Fe3+-siderophore transport system permease subunit